MTKKNVLLAAALNIIAIYAVFPQTYDSVNFNKSYEYHVDGQQVELKITDTNPKHFPLFTLSNGIGVSSTPHMIVNPTVHFDSYIRIPYVCGIDIKYTKLLNAWKKTFHRDWVSSENNSAPKFAFNSLDITANIRLAKKTIPNQSSVFHSQALINKDLIELKYLVVPAQKLKYIDLSLGYLRYEDIISNGVISGDEELRITMDDGTVLEDLHINYYNEIIQIGLVLGKQEYVRGKIIDRNVQSIHLKQLYFNTLLSPGAVVEGIQYENGNTYYIDFFDSELEERYLGFKLGYSHATTLISGWFGFKYGAELALYPGIKGYPNDLKNLCGRFYLCYSFFLAKKHGKKVVI